MKTHNLGYPRIGSRRELKKACEQFWAEKISLDELLEAGKQIRLKNWQIQRDAGIDIIPSNDFSFYDQVLDMSLIVGAIPDRYRDLSANGDDKELYFAMARGFQQDGLDITAMEMTKWFDTNYHYIVPEFKRDQHFRLLSTKAFDEFNEAKALGIITKPVLIGPVSYLLLGKEKEEGFHRIELIAKLLPVYLEILEKLNDLGATYVQFDEPYLAMDLDEKEKQALKYVYGEFNRYFPHLNIILASYFDGLRDNLALSLSLPVQVLHVDLVRAASQLDDILDSDRLSSDMTLSLGLVDGRNIWKNDFESAIEYVHKAIRKRGEASVMIAPSCSLLHCPCDLELETDESTVMTAIKPWLAFAKQKLHEVVTIKSLAATGRDYIKDPVFIRNLATMQERRGSTLIHNEDVKKRSLEVAMTDVRRQSPYIRRKELQRKTLSLPQFPTTTIGSFPQTTEVRRRRSKYKKGETTQQSYVDYMKKEIETTIRWQEEIDLDVLVHGEFERNDMAEYFGEKMNGFAFTKYGWVQSYGSRCVKPPIIYGDVQRPRSMTVEWSSYAQSLTDKTVKGMLTGPVTLLQWSFVRNDQPRSETCNQIALAICDEVLDLERAGIKVIQVDEPAIREGLPLRKSDWNSYLKWAVKAFRIATSAVKDETQIHTHMCYSEFNDIIHNIADMDADVITIECSRSQMELLDAFADFHYPNEIGPGVYDIHSPRVPTQVEMVSLLEKARMVIPADQLWVNPDCGLKTRHWDETKKALIAMVSAAKQMRQEISESVI